MLIFGAVKMNFVLYYKFKIYIKLLNIGIF